VDSKSDKLFYRLASICDSGASVSPSSIINPFHLSLAGPRAGDRLQSNESVQWVLTITIMIPLSQSEIMMSVLDKNASGVGRAPKDDFYAPRRYLYHRYLESLPGYGIHMYDVGSTDCCMIGAIILLVAILKSIDRSNPAYICTYLFRSRLSLAARAGQAIVRVFCLRESTAVARGVVTVKSFEIGSASQAAFDLHVRTIRALRPDLGNDSSDIRSCHGCSTSKIVLSIWSSIRALLGS
jgi:hypothetical protein